MAPNKNKSSGRASGEDLKQEDVLQAVVIADSFNVRFGPLTLKKPRALLPLVNVPLIDYTLNFLAAAGIQEVFVVCCHLADQIRTHLKNSKWSEVGSSMTVTPILSDGCMSVGDSLREIDSKSLIRSDFILITGDVVSNIAIQNIMDIHKKRREKDKSSLMTMVYKKAPIGHATRCHEDDIVLAVGTNTKRILHYQKTRQEKRLNIPADILLDHSDVQIHYELMDCQISICTPLVPQLYTDNFDYQTREDFVKGILINEEILGNTIHLHVIQDEYAARVSNLQMYDAVSKDIMKRWTFPVVPDQNYFSDKKHVSYGRHNIYKSQDVSLGRGCVLEENVFIGCNTSIGSNTHIIDSVIGDNCIIGDNVKIKGGYLWENVRVEDDCCIDTAVVASGVTIYRKTTVDVGSVLAWNVQVGPDVVLPPNVLLMSDKEKDEFADSEDEDGTDQPTEGTPEFGSKSKAFNYKACRDSDAEDDDDDVDEVMWRLKIHSDDESFDDDDSTILSDESDMLDGDFGDFGDLEDKDSAMFYSELIDTLKRAKEENIKSDNVILEINSLKHAYNISINDVNMSVVKAVLDLPLEKTNTADRSNLLNAFKNSLSEHRPLMLNYIKSSEAQIDCLKAVEELCINNEFVRKILGKLILHMYNEDYIEENNIFKWYSLDSPNQTDPFYNQIQTQVDPLIKWLKEAEEESSEED
ncbi:hypothetical protein LOTGIDRAFT_225095, partial [Lottia gigantea]